MNPRMYMYLPFYCRFLALAAHSFSILAIWISSLMHKAPVGAGWQLSTRTLALGDSISSQYLPIFPQTIMRNSVGVVLTLSLFVGGLIVSTVFDISKL